MSDRFFKIAAALGLVAWVAIVVGGLMPMLRHHHPWRCQRLTARWVSLPCGAGSDRRAVFPVTFCARWGREDVPAGDDLLPPWPSECPAPGGRPEGEEELEISPRGELE